MGPQLTLRFLEETQSEYLADDGENVTVYFSTPLADVVCKHDPRATDWHWQAMKRLRLLEQIFPGRKSYGSQGLGLSPLQLQHDPTLKNIKEKATHSERATHLNATLLAIVAYRHQRVNSWKEYSDAVVKYRQMASACLRKLYLSWAKLLSFASPPASAFKKLPGAEMEALKQLSKLPMFPRCAVDEWGFISEDRSESPGGDQRLAELRQRFGSWRKALGDFAAGIGRVESSIIPITIIFAAEQKGYRATAEDEKTTHLMLFNLATAWEALAPLQMQFRKLFGQIYSTALLDELDRNERSNFRLLWPVVFAMDYDRKERIINFGYAKERQESRVRAQFLGCLEAEIASVIGSDSVSLADSPWVLDDETCLRVVCNHSSVASYNENGINVVRAIWRACQFKQWRNMEWQPLVIEWPKLAVVHTLKGKALSCACARLSTMVFLASENNFEIQQHHLFAVPVSRDAFAAIQIPLWDNPLMERLFALQGALVAFCVTVPRFFEVFSMAETQDIQEADSERIFSRYSKELNLVWQEAQSEFERTQNALSICVFPQANAWEANLLEICEKLLFAVNSNTLLSLTLDDFLAWSEFFESEISRFHILVSEVLTVILE